MADAPSHQAQPQLLRAMGRWSMVALAINSVIGSGIFGLPAVLAQLIGRASPLAVLIAGAGMGVIIACYAEVASQFTTTGGTYLYVRRAFGRLIGLQVGWLTLLARLTACAGAVNLFVAYLQEFWPAAAGAVVRVVVISVFVGSLAAVNYRGVGGGARLSDFAAVAKLVPLGVLCVAGIAWLGAHARLSAPPVAHPVADWLQAMLLLLFAYGGAEVALNPAGEARDPRRDTVFALFAALLVVAGLYSVLQLIVTGVLTDPAHSERPLADTARVLLGPHGAALISAGALVSVYGYMSANLLTVPRSVFALAERGDFPAQFAAVHPRWRTPHVAIAAFAALVWLFALGAGFAWNITLSAIARIFYYALVCAALPVLRRLQPEAGTFRVPGGISLPVLGIALCAVLLTRVDFSQSLVVLATLAVALGNWAVLRGRAASASGAQ